MAKRKPIAWTDRGLRNLKPEGQPYEQGFIGMRGLHVRVFPNGQKTARFQYVIDGKRYRMVLGHYPTDSAKKLRDLYGEARTERFKGVNLAEQRKRVAEEETVRKQEATRLRQIEESRLEFDTLARLYLEQYAKVNKRSWREDERILNRDILPRFGERKIEDVERQELTAYLAEIAQDAPVMANRVLACIRAMLSWGAKTGYVEVNHAVGIPRPGGVEKGKDRVLAEQEIKSFWQLTETIKNPLHRVALRLVLLTGQRPSEVSQARWDEFKKDWWVIPADRTKNGREHRVPLIPQALAELNTLPQDGEYLFPQKRGKQVPDKPIDPNTPAHVLLDAIKNAGEDIERFTPHDLRRTFATQLGDMGFLDDEIGLILNHTRQGVTQRYNRSHHDEPKRRMMNAWSRRFTEIMEGNKGSTKVMEMRA